MDTQKAQTNREKRFEVNDLIGFDAVVSRAGSDDSLYYAELIDFSRTGVKFNLPFCARFDELLKIKFEFKQSDLSFESKGRVRHMRNVDENRWQVGCSLDPSMPEEVIAYMAKRTNQERRRFPRYDVYGQGRLHRQGTVEGCDATIQNLSKGGFCLFVASEHEVGERVDLVVQNQSDEDQVVAGRIRWQCKTEEGFQIGCSFADSESYTKLVDCLTSESSPSRFNAINWLVAAAAIVALLFPSATYFIFGSTPTGNQTSVAQAQVESGDRVWPTSDQANPEKEQSTVGAELDESSIAESPLPARVANPVETENQVVSGDGHVENTEELNSSDEDGALLSPHGTGLKNVNTGISKSLPLGERATENPSAVSQPNFEEPRAPGNAGRPMSTRRFNNIPTRRPKITKPGPGAPTKPPASHSPESETKYESPIPSPPKVLRKRSWVRLQVKSPDKGSSRRIKPGRPITVPSEAIKPRR